MQKGIQMSEKCYRCGGTGMYMGNGMIMTNCNQCNGNTSSSTAGKDKITPPTLDKVDRRSKSYRDTIKNIMLASDVCHDDAVKIFDETYDKI